MPNGAQIEEPVIPPIDKESKKEDGYNLNRSQRQEEMESTGHKISIILLKIAVVVLAAIGLVRISYLILPHQWQWLDAEQVFKIDEFFIHGTIGALLVEFLRGKISIKKHD
ncbi:MAG TPA: hypothetical protein VNS32_00345 [Flavisolibacter sp.]|nr:hypothetical protein [Flavisolibacter sp.]